MTTQEYNHCVTSLSKDLLRFSYKNLKDVHDSEDVVQSAFITLWENKDKVNIDKAISYLFTIVYRRCIDIIRKNKIKYEEDMNTTYSNVSSDNNYAYEWKDYLHLALNKLDIQSRSLVILKDLEGYKYDEIASITGLTMEQVKVYLFRARKELKTMLNHINPKNISL